MNKLFILKDVAMATPRTGYDSVVATDLNSIAEGSFVILNEHEQFVSSEAGLSFAKASRFVIGTAQGAVVVPEVKLKNARITIAEPAEGVKFSATIAIDEVFPDEEYCFILVKKGTVANEHYKKTFTTASKSNRPADVINALVADINNQSKYTGITAKKVSNTIQLSAVNGYDDYAVVCTDQLKGATVTTVNAKKPILDKEYVINLIKECAADSGFRHTGMEAEKLYPGMYPELDADSYYLLSCTFFTERESAKPTDEKVNQITHILIPNTYNGKTNLELTLHLFETVIVDAPDFASSTSEEDGE
ncbi:MAG: hypothetical protein MJ209_00070 [archaeon]|nr:hypothetical protein [archaeon]